MIALLVAPDPALTARDSLVAEGRIVPAVRPFTLPRRVRLPVGTTPGSTALHELRDDRLR